LLSQVHLLCFDLVDLFSKLLNLSEVEVILTLQLIELTVQLVVAALYLLPFFLCVVILDLQLLSAVCHVLQL